MYTLRSLVGWFFVATFLAACGGAGSNAYSPVSDSDVRAAAVQTPRVKGAPSNLYVISTAPHFVGRVDVYAPGSTKVLRTISQGISNPATLAFDASGNLYVANMEVPHGGRWSPGTISVYAPGTTTPLRTISHGVSQPEVLAFDRVGNLYVVMGGAGKLAGNISVYAPGSSRLLRRIATEPAALAFDRSDNLYVANDDNVTVYSAESTSVLRTIDVQNPTALAFDRSGNLYVGNQDMGPGFNYGPGAINVYAPGGTSVLRTISTGEYGPFRVTFDGAGHLYAAESKPDDFYDGVVNGYATGGSTPIRTIAGHALMTIAFDASGNLYTANCPRQCDASIGVDPVDAVRVYAPGATSPRLTIDVPGPIALALGP